MKQYELEIFFQQNIMPEYPMGDPEEFESLDDFLNFNYEQIAEIRDEAPCMREVEQKLRNGEYEVHMSDYDPDPNMLLVTVRNVDYYAGRR